MASAQDIGLDLAHRVRERRLDMAWTQEGLAKRSGVTLASLKRFERFGLISLEGLIRLAIALDCVDAFDELFKPKPFQSLQDVLEQEAKSKRRRGSIT
jgi:transcriptional regulator with XRE-family HTH domain